MLEPCRNESRVDVTPPAEQETSSIPDQVDEGTTPVDEVSRTGAGGNVCGLEPSDNENRGAVTAAAEPGTSNKPAQEDGRAQLAKEVVAESVVEKDGSNFLRREGMCAGTI